MRIFYGTMFFLLFDSFDSKAYEHTFLLASFLSLGLIVNNIIVGNGNDQVGVLAVRMKGTLFYSLCSHILTL